MADGKVLFELELVQKGDKVQIVQRQTDKLANSTEKLDQKRKKLNKTTDAYNRREKGAAQISSNSTKNFSKMAQNIDGGGGSGGLVRAYALLAANVFALSAAFGILSRSAQIDTLTESMRQLEITSGKSIVSVARNLQEASGFGLDFAESMRAVSLATSAGFGATKIEELGKVARNAAVSLGRNLPDALDRIFRGVIKVEPELLDEIGLFVRVNDAAAKYASELKVAVGDLTEFQKRQAFLNEAIEQGTTKFAAFENVENDAFALLATTFADMSHQVISFINRGLTPLIKLLAENKILFATVFSAIGIALIKLAVPAMAAFTRSIAANAATASAAADEAAKDAQSRAQWTRNNHLSYMAQKEKELLIDAKLKNAQSREAMTKTGTIKVGGKEKSLMKEKLLRKENLAIDKRIAVVNQRILDITTGRGKKARQNNTAVQAELSALREEKRVHDQILLNRKEQENINKTSVGGPGSNVERAKLMAYNASLKATSLATIANEAQTVGLKLALRAVGIELSILTQKGAFAVGIFGALQKGMFATKAAAIALGIAAQTMWMRIMGPLSAILLFLPVLQAFNKWLGVGSAASEELTKANTNAAEALGLLAPRLEHVRSELAKIGDDDAKSYNKGMESFKNTILTTTKAISEQEEKFESYMKHATGWAKFWGEHLPNFFGAGTANAIRRGKTQIIDELKAMGDDVTPTMRKLLDELETATHELWDDALQSGFSGSNEELEAKEKAKRAEIIKQAYDEAEAYINVRSAIEGAKDSARAFTNSLIVTTVVDKPLASMRQLNEALTDGNITTLERKKLLDELANDAAVLAMLDREGRQILKNSKNDKERLQVIEDAEIAYFKQQESLIKSAAELKTIQTLSKNIASTTKVTTEAIDKTFQNEKRIGEIKAEQAKYARENARKGTDLTDTELQRVEAGESLIDILGKDRYLKTDIKAVQAAINKLMEEELILLQNKFDLATAEARETKMRAQARLNQIKDEEKINKQVLARSELETKIANFKSRGSASETSLDKLQSMINQEDSLQKTRKRRAQEEAYIARANKEIEARKMDVLAEGERQGSLQQKIYEDAAQALRDSGDDLYDSIVNGAEDGAKIFKTKVTKLFDDVIGGSDAGKLTAEGSFLGNLGFGAAAIGSKDEKGNLIFDEAERQAMAFNMVEQSLLDMADTIESVLGKDGVLLAALATTSAGLVDIGTNFEENVNKMGMFGASAATIAAGLGQVMSLVSAASQQSVNDIDKLIEAEKNRDGKSKESVAKMKALEQKKEQIQKKTFDTNKKLMIAQAIASTAAGIAATLPLMGIPGMQGFAKALMIMIGSIGAAQVAIISKLSYQGGSAAETASAPQEITVGKRENRVDVSQATSPGELAYLRGNTGVGTNANNFTPGGAAGMRRSYATGGEILVGERGAEVIKPTGGGYEVVPNDKIGGSNLNANITINAVDAAGVEEVLTAQTGTIINMLQQAAHEHGEEFIEAVNPSSYGGG